MNEKMTEDKARVLSQRTLYIKFRFFLIDNGTHQRLRGGV